MEPFYNSVTEAVRPPGRNNNECVIGSSSLTQKRIRKHNRENGGDADIELRVEFALFAEKWDGENDRVDGFEVHRKLRAECCESAQRDERQYKRKQCAAECEDEKKNTVAYIRDDKR